MPRLRLSPRSAQTPALSDTVRARIGIATGLVVVGEPIGTGESRQQTAIGETPNLAARLQAMAEPNTVVIASGTRRLVGDLFEYRELGAIVVKGIAPPVPAWQVLRPSVVESRFEALHTATLSPTGRTRGRDLTCCSAVGRAPRAARGQVVLVSGEPGLGKSRIVATLHEYLAAEPATRLRYFCSPYHQDSALFPIVDQLGRASGFALRTRPRSRLEKLEALAARAAPHDEDVAFLADLLSLPTSERHPLPTRSAAQEATDTRGADEANRGLARQQPLLMVFEDAHWIDPTTRELLDLTVERVRSLPVLLVVTFRPEFQPPWTGQPGGQHAGAQPTGSA